MVYDYIIVGTGPAGSLLAWLLSKKNFKICLIDRAKNKKIISNPYVYKSSFDYLPLFSNKLGGNSQLWHNKIFLISKDEFEEKKWGFSYATLKKLSLELEYKLDIPINKIKLFLNRNVKISQSLRFNFNNIYNYFKIENNKNISVIKESTIAKIYKKKNSVDKVDVININGKLQTIKIKKSLILCCGGLGNSHLILNLFDISKKKKVFLADHPHIKIGNYNKKDIDHLLDYKKYYLSEKKIEKNVYLKFNKTFAVIQVAVYSAEDFIRKFIKKIYNSKKFLQKITYIFLINFYYLSYKIINYFNKINHNQKFCLEVSFSQNPKSGNITLSDKHDEFGLKKINIKWNLFKKDTEDYKKIIKKAKKILKISNKYKLKESFKNVYVGQHPSCSTPITKNNKIIGVNKNLRLNGYQNIYTIGSNVFPANGFTNPTWTIMTLTLMLAKYLIKFPRK
tara:strand:+ start:181 stop:1533 length:1353 start_codon:yes stop_codon:yes gene_type:complete